MARPDVDFERLDFYVNLDRYPLHDLDSSAGKALIQRAHAMMEHDTLCQFEDFLRKSAVHKLAAEVTKLESKAYRVFPLQTCQRLTSASTEPYFGALTPPARGDQQSCPKAV